MFHLIYKYLILHKRVTIPGIGTFVLDRDPAKVDEAHHVIHAPASVVRFSDQFSQIDNVFYVYLAKELKTEVLEAIKRYHEFAEVLKREVHDKKWVELPDLGILSPGIKDEIKFKSVAALKEYYPATDAELADEAITAKQPLSPDAPEPVTLTDKNEKVVVEGFKKKRDPWALFAVLLALIALGAIAYYYYLHGGF